MQDEVPPPLAEQLQMLADDPRPDTDRLQILIYLVKQLAEKLDAEQPAA